MTDEFTLDWTNVFEDLKYKAKLSGRDDKEFGTCLKCLRARFGNFDQNIMLQEGKRQGVTIYFVDCAEHAGATV